MRAPVEFGDDLDPPARHEDRDVGRVPSAVLERRRDADRDRDAVCRIWREVGWIDSEDDEKALDIFYSSYQEEIAKAVDVSVFDGFKQILEMQIEDYLEILQDKEKEKELKDFGFFTQAIKKSKDEEES